MDFPLVCGFALLLMAAVIGVYNYARTQSAPGSAVMAGAALLAGLLATALCAGVLEVWRMES